MIYVLVIIGLILFVWGLIKTIEHLTRIITVWILKFKEKRKANRKSKAKYIHKIH